MRDLRHIRCIVCGGHPEVWIWDDGDMRQLPYCGLCEPDETTGNTAGDNNSNNNEKGTIA